MKPVADTAFLRCAVGTVADYPDHPGDWGDVDAIARLWASPGLREAVLLASPVLAARVDKVLAPRGSELPVRKRVRLHRSLLKYALRMSTRCTPFGMFAGVAVLPVGDGQPALGASHVRHVRTTGAVTRRLLDAARSLPEARLYPNPSLTERGDRLVVTVMRGVDDTDTVASIRATGPARVAVAAAGGTATRHDVERCVAAAYPAADTAVVRTLVTELLQAEVLLCESEHSAFDGDPLARVPDAVAGVADLRTAVARYSTTTDPVDDGSLARLLRLSATDAVERRLQRDVHVDLELDAAGRIPVSIVDGARDALTALTATMAHLPATPALDEFGTRFLERYGHARVPFLTAVDDHLGIGYPRADGGTARPVAAPDQGATSGRRRDLIARLLRRASGTGAGEVVLTESDLTGFSAATDVPGSVDVVLTLHREATGVRATVTGLGFPGGCTIGRFTAAMPAARDVAQRCVDLDTAQWADSTDGRGVVCGVDYIAGSDSVNEVAATAPLYPVTLAVNSRPHHPAGPVLTLADLHLGYADGRMRITLADGTPVRVRQLNVATTSASAAAIKLLREISDAGTRMPFWSWGEAEAILDHLPAVVYRGVTLTEERWRYPVTADRTTAAVRDWLAAAGVSRHVRVGPHDNRLLLDTRNSGHLDLLLDHLAAGNQWVFRAPPPEQLGVVGGIGAGPHAAEVVVTLATGAPTRPEPDVSRHPLYDTADDARRLLLPGGGWTAFAVTAPADSHDRLLRSFATAFPELAGDWYFVRYRENDRDQLRLRVRRSVADLSGVLSWLGAARLAGRIGDYSLPMHHRELERYGGARSYSCYERLFCCETACITGILPIVGVGSSTDWPVRSGVSAAAGVLSQWFDALDPGRVDADEVLELAIRQYTRELGSRAHEIKSAVRQCLPATGGDGKLLTALRGYWADPGQADAVVAPDVLQSASHLLCNRLGLRRHEEYAAIWVLQNSRNRNSRSVARR